MIGHKFEETEQGVPQGGPLSPILGNIMLGELDRELDRRGLPFVRYADMGSFLEETDQWLRGRIRMCIWKCWKRIRTRFKNLQKCGIPKWQAWQWANSRKGCCRAAHSFMHRVATNEMLKRAGYPCLMDYYVKLHPC